MTDLAARRACTAGPRVVARAQFSIASHRCTEARRKRGTTPSPTAHRTRTTILVELDRDTVLRALATRHSHYLMVGLVGVVCTPPMRFERYGRLHEETADRDRSSCAHVSRALHRMCVLNAYREHCKRRVEGRRPSRRRTDPRHAREGKLRVTVLHTLAHLRTVHASTPADVDAQRLAMRGFASTLRGIESRLAFTQNDSGNVEAATRDAKRGRPLAETGRESPPGGRSETWHRRREPQRLLSPIAAAVRSRRLGERASGG